MTLCVWVLSAGPAVSQPMASRNNAASPLTLESAVAQALASHPAVASARREFEAVRGERLQAALRPNPELGLEVEGFRRESRTTTVQIGQTVELGGKRRYRIQAGERAVEAARARIMLAESDVRAAVTSAFFGALVAREKLVLSRTSLELAGEGTRIASRRVQAGSLSPVEETRARVAEADFRLDVAQAGSDLETRLAELGVLIGSEVDAGGLKGEALLLPAIPDRASVVRRMGSAPSIREARELLAQAAAAAELERSRRTPDITLSAGIARSEGSGENLGIVGFSVPLPVLDRNHGNILAALKRRERAEEELRLSELRLRTEVEAATLRLKTAISEARTLDTDVLPGARSAYDAITRGFELGKFGALDALDAQRTWLQARARYLDAVEKTHLASIEIDRILGPDIRIDSGTEPPSSATSISTETSIR